MAQKMLKIGDVRIDGGTQARHALDEATYQEYGQEMALGASFDPIDVFLDGSDYWLADGFHRYHGAKDAGLKEIKATVHSGTRREAILFAVGANSRHGLRRTYLDKRKAVEMLLQDEEWRQWSDREIGRRCGVDDKTVAVARQRLSAEFPQMDDGRKVERNGTTYTMKPRRKVNRKAGAFYTLPESVREILKDSKAAYSNTQMSEMIRLSRPAAEKVARKLMEQSVRTVAEAKEEVLRELIPMTDSGADTPLDQIKILLPRLSAGERRELRSMLDSI